MAYTRNPNPARGPGVLSLDELRRHIRLFWKDPRYSISYIPGAKRAFIKTCEFPKKYFEQVFLSDPPEMEYLSARAQRRISKAVLNIAQGYITYVQDPMNFRRAIGFYDPKPLPPATEPPAIREIEFVLRNEGFGPRLFRVPN